MSSQECNNFLQKMNEIATKIEDGVNFVNPEYIHDFKEQIRRATEHAEEIVNVNRNLKIGIVGQVKAGKSSFLNALVFDGADILPKAATPMTAALTKISYAEKTSSAKVVFYSKKDWEVIEENSRQYDLELQRGKKNLQERKKNSATRSGALMGRATNDFSLTNSELQEIENKIPPQYRSCRELTEMAEKFPNILFKLGSEEKISVSNLQTDLEQYVGADGKYTPIVKWIEMTVANDLLKGIEIIDTPGLGDPIMSRSEKTKEFLMACDLVFILSPTPQFMSAADISLIMETLPGESINHAVLVGSKFDSAMLDDSGRGKQSFALVYKKTAMKLNDSAKKVLAESRQAEKSFTHISVLKRLEEETERQIKEEGSLYYISSLLYNASRKKENQTDLDELEAHVLPKMVERFEGMKTESEFLRKFAGIDILRKIEFEKIRKEKENIISERSQEFIKDQTRNFVKQINEIQSDAEQLLRLTETSDVTGLQKKLDTSENELSSMRREIEKTFELCAIDTKKHIVEIAHQIKSRVDENTDISVGEGSETRTHYRKESFLIFFTKKVPYEVTTIYHTANVGDVVRNLNKYITNSEKNIAEGLKFAINIHEIRHKIKEVVIRAFQKADADFDENDILMPVETVLSKVTIPEFSIVDSEKYSKMILSEFPSAQVRDEEISRLELRQTQLLNKIAEDITAKLEEKSGQIETQLKDHSLYFTDDVKKAIENRIELLKKNIVDKEGSIRSYREFLSRVAECKNELRKLGESFK